MAQSLAEADFGFGTPSEVAGAEASADISSSGSTGPQLTQELMGALMVEIGKGAHLLFVNAMN